MLLDSFSDFLQYQKRCSPHTSTAYLTDLSQFEKFYEQLCLNDGKNQDQIDLAKVTTADLRAWIFTLVESKLDNKSVNRKITALRSFYNFLKMKGIIAKSPAQHLKSLKFKKSLPIFVLEGEMETLLEEKQQLTHAEGFEGIRNKS